MRSSIKPLTADRILEQLLEMGCFRMQPQAAAVFAVEMENLQKQLVAPWRNSGGSGEGNASRVICIVVKA